MVTKKYLCAAPRPESWDEKADALLKAYDGDVKKRDKNLRQSLERLQTEFQYERRTGPGRKSNAEHAIAFYEYVLGEGGEIEQDENNTEEASSRSQSQQEEATVESMDSQDFLNQHNDECDVCSMGGELLCCSTCTLVFHLGCVRPVLEKLPDGDWSCAHCIISGSQKHKRHSKTWKSAAAAVRQMGKLRLKKLQKTEVLTTETSKEDQLNEMLPSNRLYKETYMSKKSSTTKLKENQAKEKGIHEEPESPASSGSETEQDAKTTKDPTSKGKDANQKRKGLSSRISDPFLSALKTDMAQETGRGRRPRRQPTLYDPQTCPDSRWQSDERADRHVKDSPKGSTTNNKRTTSDNESDASQDNRQSENEEDGDTPIKQLAASKSKDPRDDLDTEGTDGKTIHWCNFCRDDPSVVVCVFCACRICFGKHEKEKLLICDKCDDEYHTFCLSPPLPSVPSSKSWFCPSCSPEKVTKAAKVSTRRASSTSTSKGANAGDVKATTSKSNVGAVASTSTKLLNKVSAGRGRIRGQKSKSPPPTQILTPSRKRGRPSKATPDVMDSPSPRKRGRPPKTPIVPLPSVKKKSPVKTLQNPKRSTSPSSRKSEMPATKKSKVEESAAKTDVEIAEPEPVKVSRSGRIVRRSSFHDEREEGEQHLRTVRKVHSDSQVERQSKVKRDKRDGSESNKPTTVGEDTTDKGDKKSVDLKEANETERHDNTSEKLNEEDEATEGAYPELPVRTKVIEPPTTLKPSPPNPAPALSTNPAKNEEKNGIIEDRNEKACTTTIAPSNQTNQSVLKTPTETNQLSPSTSSSEQKSCTMKDIIPIVSKTLSSPSPAKLSAITTKDASHISKPKPASLPNSTRPKPPLNVDVKALVRAAIANMPKDVEEEKPIGPVKVPRRKPGARECMQISRRFGVRIIPKKYMDTLFDYCTRGKVEHLIRMRERLDEHSRFLESQLAGLEAIIEEKGELDLVVPALPERIQSDAPKSIQSASPASSAVARSGITPVAGMSTPRQTSVPLNTKKVTLLSTGCKVPLGKPSVPAQTRKKTLASTSSTTSTSVIQAKGQGPVDESPTDSDNPNPLVTTERIQSPSGTTTAEITDIRKSIPQATSQHLGLAILQPMSTSPVTPKAREPAPKTNAKLLPLKE